MRIEPTTLTITGLEGVCVSDCVKLTFDCQFESLNLLIKSYSVHFRNYPNPKKWNSANGLLTSNDQCSDFNSNCNHIYFFWWNVFYFLDVNSGLKCKFYLVVKNSVVLLLMVKNQKFIETLFLPSQHRFILHVRHCRSWWQQSQSWRQMCLSFQLQSNSSSRMHNVRLRRSSLVLHGGGWCARKCLGRVWNRVVQAQ